MLVSTHNLGSVPEFCDRTVLVKGTVLAYGLTKDVFNRENLELTFGGALRHFVLAGSGLHADDDPRHISVLTDDERPLVHVWRKGQDGHAAVEPGRKMIETLLLPFNYGYMINAIWVSALVGGVCAFLSAYLMLKGWSLIGDALSHSIVPGVAGAYMLGLPFSLGAFFSGGLAAAAMLFLTQRTKLKEDAIIGLIFTAFFGLGLFMISLSPTAVNIQTIVLGNILAVTPEDTVQLVIIALVTLAVMLVLWKDLMVTFFDESHARSIGLNPPLLKAIFFTLLSACTVAAMQTVGAFLVIAMVVTPGATAYLLTDRFPRLILIAVLVGTLSSLFGAYISFFLDGATGGVIVVLQVHRFPRRLLLCPQAWSARRPPPHRRGDGAVNEFLIYALWPFQFPFMTQAMIIAVLVAVPTALLSCFLVLKGWSLMGDAISHAVLPGVVLAYIVGLPLGVGAFAAGMSCALITGYLKENSRIKEDTVMGVVFSGLFGLGIVLYTSIQTDVHLDHILFGDILGVNWGDIAQTGIIAAIVVAIIAAKWRDLLLFVFDPQQAGAIGLPVRWSALWPAGHPVAHHRRGAHRRRHRAGHRHAGRPRRHRLSHLQALRSDDADRHHDFRGLLAGRHLCQLLHRQRPRPHHRPADERHFPRHLHPHHPQTSAGRGLRLIDRKPRSNPLPLEGRARVGVLRHQFAR